jgi:hypothetical protein
MFYGFAPVISALEFRYFSVALWEINLFHPIRTGRTIDGIAARQKKIREKTANPNK